MSEDKDLLLITTDQYRINELAKLMVIHGISIEALVLECNMSENHICCGIDDIINLLKEDPSSFKFRSRDLDFYMYCLNYLIKKKLPKN